MLVPLVSPSSWLADGTMTNTMTGSIHTNCGFKVLVRVGQMAKDSFDWIKIDIEAFLDFWKKHKILVLILGFLVPNIQCEAVSDTMAQSLISAQDYTVDVMWFGWYLKKKEDWRWSSGPRKTVAALLSQGLACHWGSFWVHCSGEDDS